MVKVITDDISKYGIEWWEKFYKIHGHHNNAEELATFRKSAQIVGDKSVIDVGCGEGEASKYFSNYYGIDWSQIVIERCRKNWQKRFDVKDIKDVTEHFDYALLSQVMEHLEHPVEYVQEIKRIADKVIIIIPNGDIGKIRVDSDRQYLADMGDTDYHYATYTAEDIEKMFKVEQWILTGGNNLLFVV